MKTLLDRNDTGYTIWYHYEKGEKVGGFVRCEDCKVQRDFVGLKAMNKWLDLHATPGSMFSCRILQGS